MADPTAWWSCWPAALISVQTTTNSIHYFGLNLILLARGNIQDMGITSLIITRVPYFGVIRRPPDSLYSVLSTTIYALMIRFHVVAQLVQAPH